MRCEHQSLIGARSVAVARSNLWKVHEMLLQFAPIRDLELVALRLPAPIPGRRV